MRFAVNLYTAIIHQRWFCSKQSFRGKPTPPLSNEYYSCLTVFCGAAAALSKISQWMNFLIQPVKVRVFSPSALQTVRWVFRCTCTAAHLCVYTSRDCRPCAVPSAFSQTFCGQIIKDNVVMKRAKCLSLNQIKSFKKHAKEEAPNVISKRSKSEILQQFSFTQSFDTEINLHGNM